tara:strand:- start:514 stop:690 length:177 start_codon:yes stop_codon:yes gene_type:complete
MVALAVITFFIVMVLVSVSLDKEEKGSGDKFIEGFGQTVTLLFFGGVVLTALYLFIFS